jgi:hypothetical protein
MSELTNPFQPTEPTNPDDTAFIRELLGDEVAAHFAELGGQPPPAPPPAADWTPTDFYLTATERANIETELPHDYWPTVERLLADDQLQKLIRKSSALDYWFEDHSSELPSLTFAQLPHLAASLDQFLTRWPVAFRDELQTYTGNLFTHLLRTAITNLPEIDQARVDLTVTLPNDLPLEYLGNGWQTGTLRLIGRAGDAVGILMSGGTIITEEAGGSLGCSMSGGTIIAKQAGHNLGSSMSGGTIIAKQAGMNVGFGIPVNSTGTIQIQEQAASYATYRQGGTIIGPDGRSVPLPS